ncbi:hypothetical protein KSP40_PGU022722 [Platanthera guangdongensis]|uniref:Late embryogenesis abundant protein LEA-2 subgroup domain-containing protein n=1 Tax=Platanthera guangdongensis TaxID=2320717 RepID=A0ABR2LSL4_9ASPA
MAERVHPEPLFQPPQKKPGIQPAESTHQPSSVSFVIQLPKDQIYSIPPAGNAYLFDFYRRRVAKRRRSRCCRCVAWSFASLFLLLIALAAIIGVLYLIFLPKLPSFSIESLSIHGLNVSSAVSAAAALSPEILLTVRSENPNKKIGIYYRDGSYMAIAFSGVVIGRGTWPSFYQGPRNVTSVQPLLTGSGIRLSNDSVRLLTSAVNSREVPLEIRVQVPARVKFGAITSWTTTVKLRCDVTVDVLTADARVLNKSCKAKVDII